MRERLIFQKEYLMRLFPRAHICNQGPRAFSAVISLIAGMICFCIAPVAAQGNTVWSLNPAVPHAKASDRSYYPTTFAVHHADSEGGHVQARAIKPGEPNCFALFDFDWTFSSPLDLVHQGDIVEIKIELGANPGSDCPPPLDPLIYLAPLKGTINNTAIAGSFTEADQELILWHPNTPAFLGRVDLQNAPNRVNGEVFQLKVDDTRTTTGRHRNAQRGGFKIVMQYRGTTYEAYYLYSAQ